MLFRWYRQLYRQKLRIRLTRNVALNSFRRHLTLNLCEIDVNGEQTQSLRFHPSVPSVFFLTPSSPPILCLGIAEGLVH